MTLSLYHGFVREYGYFRVTLLPKMDMLLPVLVLLRCC